MRTRSIALALLLAAIAVPALTQTPTPRPRLTAAHIPNLDTVKDEIRFYYTSGDWNREVEGVAAQAEAYVDARVAQHPVRPAIVLDIDDTALSDYAYEAGHDFGYDSHSYNLLVIAEAFPAIAPTLALAKHAKADGVAVFFITGRRTPLRSVTLGNLLKVGFPQPDGLFLRPPSDHARSIIPFKSSVRAHIQALGYTVLLSMGDQWSDLRGGHAERDFKLPNPMYFIP